MAILVPGTDSYTKKLAKSTYLSDDELKELSMVQKDEGSFSVESSSSSDSDKSSSNKSNSSSEHEVECGSDETG